MTAVCFCRVRKTLAHVDYRTASNIICARSYGGAYMRGTSRHDSPACSALTIFANALSHPIQRIEPPVLREYPAYNLKKEHIVDSGAKEAGRKSLLPYLKRMAEQFHKAGSDVPRRTINLARDDLESIFAVPRPL
ncbi:MAG: hypothetical protein HZB83_05380 [Deltaproteobacteria bacterium]|nr:hypothetical protein [Deltaproteobacteria bacterium]